MAEAGKVRMTIEGQSLMSKALAEAGARFRDSMDRLLCEAMGMNGYMQAVSGGVLTRDELRKAAALVTFPKGETVVPRYRTDGELRRDWASVMAREGARGGRMELDKDGFPVGRVVWGVDVAAGDDRASIRLYQPRNVPSLYGDEFEDARRIDPRAAFDAERVCARAEAALDRDDELTAIACARDTARHRRATALPSRRLATNMHRNDRVVLRLDREDALDGGQ